MTRTLRIGMAQTLVVPGDADANLARAADAIAAAAAERCDAVVLPECLDLGWSWPEAPARAEPIPGPSTERLAEAARSAAVHVVAGLTERDGDRTYNAAVVIGPDGAILARHRKIHELDFARAVYAQGTTLEVADTALGPVGVDICADNAYESLALGRALAAMGARILLSPCAWAVPPDFDNSLRPYGDEWITAYGALARETGMPVVGVSNVGPVVGGEWEGWRCIGASLAVGADGEVLAQLPFGDDAEALLALDVPWG